MRNKYLYLIPLGVVEIILQLTFFWLAPKVPCYWGVYGFGTFMSLIHIAMIFVLGVYCGIRRSAATVVAGSVCQIMLIISCVGLIASGASMRNAIFLLLIISMVYVVITTLLLLALEKRGEEISEPVSLVDNELAHNEPQYVERVPAPMPVSSVRTQAPRIRNVSESLVSPPPLPVKR